MSRNEQISIALLALSLKSAEPFVDILPSAYEDVATALIPYVALEPPAMLSTIRLAEMVHVHRLTGALKPHCFSTLLPEKTIDPAKATLNMAPFEKMKWHNAQNCPAEFR